MAYRGVDFFRLDTLLTEEEIQRMIQDAQSHSDDDKKKINDLKADLDKQIAEHDKLLAELENAFMDSKTFNGMTVDEQRKYMALFQVIRDADNVIDKTLAKINGLIKEMNFKFGDLNSDGKIDKHDLAQMLKLVAFPIAPFFRPPAVYNKAADLDGDGVKEMVVETHSRMWILDAPTGAVKQFYKWDVSPANVRSYGLFGSQSHRGVEQGVSNLGRQKRCDAIPQRLIGVGIYDFWCVFVGYDESCFDAFFDAFLNLQDSLWI